MESTLAVKQRFGIIGDNPILNRAIEKSIQVANSDISVLVTGESGVGKENIPKIIHQYSHRKHSKYIAVNCGAIPDGTIDSELFGHEKGAFTGATANRSGYFEVADGGTIFLDEVGELPLSTQVRLLRVLESGEFIKVGSSKVEKTNVRIVAATNVNMEDAIKKGKFREDLFYRLSTIIIDIPPLRNRKEDIPILFRKFASDFAQKYNMPTLRLDEAAQQLLCQQDWKGNIRQLRNLIERVLILGNPASKISSDELVFTGQKEKDNGEKANLISSELAGMSLREAREIFERDYLMLQINRFGGNISKTAAFVEMERSALHRKLKSLGINSSQKF